MKMNITDNCIYVVCRGLSKEFFVKAISIKNLLEASKQIISNSIKEEYVCFDNQPEAEAYIEELNQTYIEELNQHIFLGTICQNYLDSYLPELRGHKKVKVYAKYLLNDFLMMSYEEDIIVYCAAPKFKEFKVTLPKDAVTWTAIKPPLVKFW